MNSSVIKQQIQALLVDRPSVNIDGLFLYVNAFNALHELIHEDEVIKGYCLGLIKRTTFRTSAGEWLVVCTNQRLLFVLKGLISKGEHFSLPLNSITFFTPKTGWFFGEATILDSTGGVKISQIKKSDFSFFTDALNKALAESKK